MPIIVNLDIELAKRKMKLTDLADRVGITIANLSILKQGRRGRSASPRSRRSAGSSAVSRGISSSTGR